MSNTNMNQPNDQSDKQTDDQANEHAVFEARVQAVLRDSANHLDGHTQSRLTQARYAALEAAKPSASRLFGWKLLAPLSAATAAAVLAVMLMPMQAPHSSAPTLLADMPDKIEILAAEDSLEFYRDVDFYAWLDTELGDEANSDSPQSEA